MYSHCDEKSGIRGYTDAKSAKDAKGYTEEGEGRYKVVKNSNEKSQKVSFYNIASEASYFFAKVVFGAKIQKRYFSDVIFWWF